MKAVAAYLLCVLGGNDAPAKADIEKVLNSVDAEVDGDAIDRLLAGVEGKDLDEAITAGMKKLVSVGGAGAAAGGAAAGGAAAEAAAEESEEEEEESAGGAGGLFDDDEDDW